MSELSEMREFGYLDENPELDTALVELGKTIRKLSDKIEVELCGKWLWVDGETKPVKEELKKLGLRWASKKEKWYFAGTPAHSWGKTDMEQIRNLHGSEIIR